MSLRQSWPSDGFVWTEAHLRVSQEGDDEVLFFSGPQRRAFQSSAGLATYTWTTDGELAGGVKVELLVDNLTLETEPDYLIPYHPGFNEVFTTAGFDGSLTNAWDASSNVSSRIHDGKFPVAWPAGHRQIQ